MQRSNYPTPTGACRLLEDFIVGPGNLPMVRCTLIAVVHDVKPTGGTGRIVPQLSDVSCGPDSPQKTPRQSDSVEGANWVGNPGPNDRFDLRRMARAGAMGIRRIRLRVSRCVVQMSIIVKSLPGSGIPDWWKIPPALRRPASGFPIAVPRDPLLLNVAFGGELLDALDRFVPVNAQPVGNSLRRTGAAAQQFQNCFGSCMTQGGLVPRAELRDDFGSWRELLRNLRQSLRRDARSVILGRGTGDGVQLHSIGSDELDTPAKVRQLSFKRRVTADDEHFQPV